MNKIFIINVRFTKGDIQLCILVTEGSTSSLLLADTIITIHV
jgi:hypothetical protein